MKRLSGKTRNTVRFLEEGDKAKITLRFRGREMAHQQIGMEVLNRERRFARTGGDPNRYEKQIEGR